MRLSLSLCLLPLILICFSCQPDKEIELIDEIIRMKFSGDYEGQRRLAKNCADNTCEFIYSFIDAQALLDLELPKEYFLAKAKIDSYTKILIPSLKPKDYIPLNYTKESLFYSTLKDEYEILYLSSLQKFNLKYKINQDDFITKWKKNYPSTSQEIYFKYKLSILKINYFSNNDLQEKARLLSLFNISYLGKYYPNSQYIQNALSSKIAFDLYRERQDSLIESEINFFMKKASFKINNPVNSIIESNRYFYDGLVNKAISILQNQDITSYSIHDKLNLYQSLEKFHLSNQNRDSAAIYNLKIREIFLEEPCHKKAIINLCFALEKAKSKSEYDSLSLLIEESYSCPVNSEYFQYFQSLFTIDNKWNPLTPQEKLKILKNKRVIAEKIWGFKPSEHLQDLYAQITHDQLTNYIQIQQKLNLDSLTNIVNLLNKTKAIELKRKRNQFEDYIEKNDSLRPDLNILEIIAETNNGLDTTYYKHPIYLKLEKHLIESDFNQKEDHLKILTVDNIDSTTQFIEYFKFSNYYWKIGYINKQIIIDTILTENIEDFLMKFENRIISNSSLTKEIEQLKTVLLEEELSGECIILPDGMLFNFPFELLISTLDFRYHHSLGEYLKSRPYSINKQNTLLFSYSDQETNSDRRLKSIPELKHGMKEVFNIKEELGIDNNQLYSGYTFQKDILMSQAQNASLWHLSTHASSSSDNKYKSYFLVRDQQKNVIPFYSFEIEESIDCPEVVILSACETSDGKFITGGGTFSVSRSFLVGGSKTVLKTLWKVNEKATSILMQNLYKEWNVGLSLNEALNNAKQDLQNSEEYAHPYFWAGFIIEGNSEVYLTE